MKRTNFYLDEQQTASLDRLAGEQGVSRAEVIRQLLDRALHGTGDNLTADLKSIEDSFGVLVGAQWPGRGPGAREQHLDRIWHRVR